MKINKDNKVGHKKDDKVGYKFITLKTKNNMFSVVSLGKKTESLAYIERTKQLEKLVGNLEDAELADRKNVEIISSAVLKEKLESVAEKSVPQNKKRSNIWSIIFLVINIFVVYLLAKSLFSSADDATIANLISVQGAKLNWILVGILLYLVIIFADSAFVSVMLKKTTGKARPWLSFRTSIIGKYYEAITPLAAGGQPSQIVYMVKRKVSPGAATSIPIMRVTLLNFSNIILSLVLFVFVVPNLPSINGFIDILTGLLKILAYIGIFVNTLYLIVMVIVANSKVFGRSLARNLIKIGYSLRIVKDYRKAYKNFMNQVLEFQNSISYLNKNFGLLAISLALILIEIMAYASIPFFITAALSDVSIFASGLALDYWIETIALYFVCYMASAFIPLPGGTGMMEISFIILFTPLIGKNFVVWGFLLWRILTYYLNILSGFVLTIGDVIAQTLLINKDKTHSNKTTKNCP